MSDPRLESPRRPELTAETLPQTPARAIESAELSRPVEPEQHPGAPRIAGYVLTSKLGEGAYGQVWRAWQERTTKEVAVKVFLRKAGLDWLFLQREVERLARLDKHAHVVTLLDAAFDHDPPFYAMELVTGGTLAGCVNAAKPVAPKQAMEWMRQLAEALAYIHGKGLIHCDLKPGNVLIDEQGSLRISDFGQSRIFTEASAALGTLFYMAPEQAVLTEEGQPPHPDVRWDVYALGATIYALLMGHAPHATEDNRRALDEAATLAERLERYRAMVCGAGDCCRARGADLSASASPSADRERNVAASPLTKGGRQGGLFPRDAKGNRRLDPEFAAIVGKCLAPDPAERYASIADFRADLDALERNLPVSALPQTRRYRVQKFIRRNRALALSATVVSGALVLGTIGTSMMLFRARAAEQRERTERVRAEEGEAFAEKARRKAEEAREEAETVTSFLCDMLASVRPGERGREVSVRQVLDEAAQTIGEKLAHRPLVQAHLHAAIGGSYHALGLPGKAETHLTEAVAIYTRQLGPRDRRTLVGAGNLASVISARGDFAQAEASLRGTLAVQRRVLGEEHPETLASMNDLANSLSDQGRSAEAETLYRQTLEIRRRVLGPEHPETLMSMNNLASCLFAQGHHTDAETLYGQAMEIQRRVLGTEDPTTLLSTMNLASSLSAQGRYAEADTLGRQTLEIQRRVLGPEHPGTLVSTMNLASALSDQSRYAEAETLVRQTLEIQHRVLGPEHAGTLGSTRILATILSDQGRYAEAETLVRQTLEIQRRVLGEEHPDVAHSLYGLAAILVKIQRWAEAEPPCREAGSIYTARLRAEHPARRRNDNLLGGILAGLARFAEAEPLLIESYDALHNDAGTKPKNRKEMLDRFVRLYESWDAAEPGKGYAEKAAEWRAKLDELEKEQQGATQDPVQSEKEGP